MNCMLEKENVVEIRDMIQAKRELIESHRLITETMGEKL
jgi:hypothetical protein